jgi:hypothetical protein
MKFREIDTFGKVVKFQGCSAETNTSWCPCCHGYIYMNSNHMDVFMGFAEKDGDAFIILKCMVCGNLNHQKLTTATYENWSRVVKYGAWF